MRVALLGAGHIGQTIARLLGDSGDYQVTVVDKSASPLAKLDGLKVSTTVADTADTRALLNAVRGHDAVINALPYHLATLAATQAREAGCHYFDLTEDVAHRDAHIRQEDLVEMRGTGRLHEWPNLDAG